jgi:hypothetical protein
VKRWVALSIVLAVVLFLSYTLPAFAHRSGCHRWHSCPSDRGTYTCGDLGYCGQCSDNQFCRAGQPIGRSAPPAETQKQMLKKGGVLPAAKFMCPADHPIKGNLTTKTGECIYHVPGGEFYSRTNPEICFMTEQEAVGAGCRRSKR